MNWLQNGSYKMISRQILSVLKSQHWFQQTCLRQVSSSDFFFFLNQWILYFTIVHTPRLKSVLFYFNWSLSISTMCVSTKYSCSTTRCDLLLRYIVHVTKKTKNIFRSSKLWWFYHLPSWLSLWEQPVFSALEKRAEKTVCSHRLSLAWCTAWPVFFYITIECFYCCRLIKWALWARTDILWHTQRTLSL